MVTCEHMYALVSFKSIELTFVTIILKSCSFSNAILALSYVPFYFAREFLCEHFDLSIYVYVRTRTHTHIAKKHRYAQAHL